jgi:hypothetical protein
MQSFHLIDIIKQKSNEEKIVWKKQPTLPNEDKLRKDFRLRNINTPALVSKREALSQIKEEDSKDESWSSVEEGVREFCHSLALYVLTSPGVKDESLLDPAFTGMFSLYGISNDNINIKDMTSLEQASLIEVLRARIFLEKTFYFFKDWSPLKIFLQIKIYSLQAHIKKKSLTEEVTQLFQNFFSTIIPKLPADIIFYEDEIGSLNVLHLYASIAYDMFLEEVYSDYLIQSASDITTTNYDEQLTHLLSLTSDPIAHRIIIDAVFKNLKQEDYEKNFIVPFFRSLEKHAKNGIIAAYGWITSGLHAFIQVDQMTPEYSQFSIQELISFLIKSTTSSLISLELVLSFFKKLMQGVTLSEKLILLPALISGENNLALYLLQFQALEELSIVEPSPEILQLQYRIKKEMVCFYDSVCADPGINPLFFEMFPTIEDYKELKSAEEVRKNSRVFAQSVRTRSGLFKKLPEVLLHKIAGWTSSEIHTQADAEKIARDHFKREVKLAR